MVIWKRLLKMLRAGLHHCMDRIEDPQKLLKQCFREMAEELHVKKEQDRLLALELKELGLNQQRLSEERSRYEDDLDLALEQKQDDLARMLINRILVLKAEGAEIRARKTRLEQDRVELQAVLREQRFRFDSLKLQARSCLRPVSCERKGTIVAAPYDAGVTEVEMELLRRKELYAQQNGTGEV